MIFGDGHQLPEAIAGIAEPRNAGCGRRFFPQVFLHDVIAVQAVLLSELDVNVCGSLIERHVSNGAAGKQIPSGLVSGGSGTHQVGRWYQRPTWWVPEPPETRPLGICLPAAPLLTWRSIRDPQTLTSSSDSRTACTAITSCRKTCGKNRRPQPAFRGSAIPAMASGS